jgi:hypothetical protein
MTAAAIRRRDYAERQPESGLGRARLSHYPAAVQSALIEAERRWRNFQRPNGEALERAWIGLGYPRDYRPAVKAGLMRPLSEERPRCLQWYLLTPAGVRALRSIYGSRI